MGYNQSHRPTYWVAQTERPSVRHRCVTRC